MYIDMYMKPMCTRYRVYEEGRLDPLGLVVAIDTDEGYVLEFRRVKGSKIMESTELPSGKFAPRVFKRYGKFRLEEIR